MATGFRLWLGGVALVGGALALSAGGCGNKRKRLECEHSCACEQLGRCSEVRGRCGVGSDADCRRSRVCKLAGACTAVESKCVATRDEDCAASETCRIGKNCTVRDGTCKK